jgi:hypothetical protein
MEILVLVALGSCAATALLFMRRRTRARTPQPAAAPRRIINPSRAGRPEVHAWLLRASPDCELTYSMLHNRRYSTEAAPPLPTIGCRLTECRCHYEAILETRHVERRERSDRRAELRFEASDDRRGRAQRRQRDGWTAASLH